jgi:hypothetical protein
MIIGITFSGLEWQYFPITLHNARKRAEVATVGEHFVNF